MKWFHCNLSREAADELLKQGESRSGALVSLDPQMSLAMWAWWSRD